MCWKVLQYRRPDDFVIATEKQYSVKFFVEQCFKFLGMRIKWSGYGLKEKAELVQVNKKYPNLKKGMTVVRISKKYFRPNEVPNLKGNANKAKRLLNWKAKTNISELINEMMTNDLELVRKSLLR